MATTPYFIGVWGFFFFHATFGERQAYTLLKQRSTMNTRTPSYLLGLLVALPGLVIAIAVAYLIVPDVVRVVVPSVVASVLDSFR